MVAVIATAMATAAATSSKRRDLAQSSQAVAHDPAGVLDGLRGRLHLQAGRRAKHGADRVANPRWRRASLDVDLQCGRHTARPVPAIVVGVDRERARPPSKVRRDRGDAVAMPTGGRRELESSLRATIPRALRDPVRDGDPAARTQARVRGRVVALAHLRGRNHHPVLAWMGDDPDAPIADVEEPSGVLADGRDAGDAAIPPGGRNGCRPSASPC